MRGQVVNRMERKMTSSATVMTGIGAIVELRRRYGDDEVVEAHLQQLEWVLAAASRQLDVAGIGEQPNPADKPELTTEEEHLHGR